MRRELSRPAPRLSRGLAWALLLGLAAAPTIARGQVPQPEIPDLSKRSGLITRFVPIVPNLPHDKDRDDWYDTRFVDHPRLWKNQNYNIKNSGLYGLDWGGNCTATVYPFFYGTPGGSIGPECRPWPRPLRFIQGLVHPFRPIGMYYDQGAYVPIYDLDPVVPGPGSYPIPWYLPNPAGG
jgi:hypothetical protein